MSLSNCEKEYNNLAKTLMNTKGVLVFVFDKAGSLLNISNSAKELLGLSDTHIAINKIFDLRVAEIIKKLEANSEITDEINLINKDKNYIPTKTTFCLENDSIIAFSTVLEEKLTRKAEISKLSRALNRISVLLNAGYEMEDILELILDDLRAILEYDKAMILFLDGNKLQLKASRNIVDNFNAGFEKKLQDSNALNNLLKVKNTTINNFSEVSVSMFEKLGLSSEKPFSYILTPLKIRDTLFGSIILIRYSGEPFNNVDAEIAEVFANAAAYSIKDAELGNVFKMQLKILNDNVIERTKTVEIIKEQNQKILEADKMKNEFLANMSHELRTPLNAIIGFSEALKLKIFGELNSKQHEYAEDIHSSGVHLLGMINDLLDLSKIEAKKMTLYKKQFSVNQALQEVINVISALAQKKQIDIQVKNNTEGAELFADHTKFQQIMYNLLSNAIKFTNNNGIIEIIVNKVTDNLEFQIKDNGIGIDPQHHEKIFAKFQQVDNSYTREQGSTGLGLTITKELVEMHGGKIRVESKLNNGANFIFVLPVSDIEK